MAETAVSETLEVEGLAVEAEGIVAAEDSEGVGAAASAALAAEAEEVFEAELDPAEVEVACKMTCLDATSKSRSGTSSSWCRSTSISTTPIRT